MSQMGLRLAVAAVTAVVTLGVASPSSAQSIDLNSDGVRDILLQDAASKNVAAWLVNADGQLIDFVQVGAAGTGNWSVTVWKCFSLSCGFSTDQGPWAIVGTRDLNADGVSDIVLQSPQTTVIGWLMDGAGHPTTAVKVTDPVIYCYGDATCNVDTRWRVVAIADIDQDGLTDLVFSGGWLPYHLSGNLGGVRYRSLDAMGTAGATHDIWPYDTNGWTVVGAADVNGDAIDDLLLQYAGGQVAAWLMNFGPTDFVFVSPYETEGWRVVGTMDLNHDGTEDVLLQYSAGHVGAWIMNQSGEPTDFVWIWPYEAGPWLVNGR